MLGEGAHAQVRLEASTRPTAAQGPVRIGTHMPNFAGPGARPTHRAVIDDDTRANAHLADLNPIVVANEADLAAYAVAYTRPGVADGPSTFATTIGLRSARGASS